MLVEIFVDKILLIYISYEYEVERHERDLKNLNEVKEELSKFRDTVKQAEESCHDVKKKLKTAEETWQEQEKQFENDKVIMDVFCFLFL